MSHKKIIGILLGLSIIGILVGFVFSEPVMLGICDKEARSSCIRPLGDNLGQPLFLSSMALGVVFIILLFLSKPYFTVWRKFAVWFVPLAALWVMTSPTTGGSGLGVGFGFDRELAIMWSSGIYIVVSLLILIVTAVRNKKNKDIS